VVGEATVGGFGVVLAVTAGGGVERTVAMVTFLL
jgi:hypothetical protein